MSLIKIKKIKIQMINLCIIQTLLKGLIKKKISNSKTSGNMIYNLKVIMNLITHMKLKVKRNMKVKVRKNLQIMIVRVNLMSGVVKKIGD